MYYPRQKLLRECCTVAVLMEGMHPPHDQWVDHALKENLGVKNDRDLEGRAALLEDDLKLELNEAEQLARKDRAP